MRTDRRTGGLAGNQQFTPEARRSDRASFHDAEAFEITPPTCGIRWKGSPRFRVAAGRGIADTRRSFLQEVAVRSRPYDEWTIERWRIEPRLRPREVEIDDADHNPPLWKDVTLASVVAVLLWTAAALFFK
jgi:hypothetical protein